MEATLVPATPAQLDFRAELHHVIDQIQDKAVLRAALLLLTPQVAAPEAESELSPAWKRQLEIGLRELDEGKGIPAAEVFARLQKGAA